MKAVEGEPDADLARVALLVFDTGGLNQPDEAKDAARVLAADANDTQTYLLLVRYAAAAKDKRTASLAAPEGGGPRPEGSAQAGRSGRRSNCKLPPPRGSDRAARLPFRGRSLPELHRTTPGRRVNFHIEDEAIDDTTHVIELGGEVDLYTAPEFKERMVELIESGKKRIVVDLSKATFIDSTTLGVLVGGVKRLRPGGGSLALVCTDENITKIFEITGLDRVFPIHSSRDEALAAVSAAD